MTNEIKLSVDLLVDKRGARIEVTDDDARVTIVSFTMPPDMFCSALGRLVGNKVTGQVGDLSRVGLVHESKQLSFEIPDYGYKRKDRIDEIHDLALEACEDGWVPDKYYNSRDSFYTKDGKDYARVTIRRWVPRDAGRE